MVPQQYVKTGVSGIPPKCLEMGVPFTATLQRFSEGSSVSVSTSAFFRRTPPSTGTRRGNGQNGFTEAESNMYDLVPDYQQYHGATAEENGEFDEAEASTTCSGRRMPCGVAFS